MFLTIFNRAEQAIESLDDGREEVGKSGGPRRTSARVEETVCAQRWTWKEPGSPVTGCNYDRWDTSRVTPVLTSTNHDARPVSRRLLARSSNSNGLNVDTKSKIMYASATHVDTDPTVSATDVPTSKNLPVDRDQFLIIFKVLSRVDSVAKNTKNTKSKSWENCFTFFDTLCSYLLYKLIYCIIY